MITPNKFIPFSESVLSKIPLIVKEVEKGTNIIELYHKLEKRFSGIDQFIYTIDLLYTLDYLDVEEETGNVTNVN